MGAEADDTRMRRPSAGPLDDADDADDADDPAVLEAMRADRIAVPPPTGAAVAERIRAVLADRPGLNDGTSCTVSLGVCGPVSSGLDSALRLADAALYRAKAGGRDRVEIAETPLGKVPDDLSTTGLSVH